MKKLRLIHLLFLLISSSISAQINLRNSIENVSYEKPVEYEIAGITIQGITNLDKNAIITLSGLTVGDKIMIPGEEISKAITKLWAQNLFADIQIQVSKILGTNIFLDLVLQELPRLSKFGFKGGSKSEVEKIREKVELVRGKIVNDNLINNTKHVVKEYFTEKGFLNANVSITQITDTAEVANVILEINIDKGEKIKINEINFNGVTKFKIKKLKRQLKDTKEKSFFRIFKTSKFLDEAFETDLQSIVALYNEKGYRDARIVKKEIVNVSDKLISINLTIEEGLQYHFRDISWLGNTKYDSDYLDQLLGINSGDIYDQKMMNDRLQMSMSGTDISSLYMDDGYLFFNIDPIEILAEKDSIDFEIRIYEGKQATINKVSVTGNTKTNEHVIMREIRTKPGELFRRSDVIRSQEEINRLNYFNPQTLGVTPKPDPQTGNVDIEYTVEEKPSDQIELQGGWGAGRVVGTFGLTFNNFSLRNFFNKETWSPLPSGDGQRISLRASSNGSFFQNYSFSFTEPWLGGNKPNSLSFTIYQSIQNYSTPTVENRMDITGINLGLGKRLRWPDDYFSTNQSISFQQYKLTNRQLVPGFSNGTSKNITFKSVVSRSSIFDPIFPKAGSQFTLTGHFTPPYSLFNDKDYSSMELAEKYEWLEYFKVKFSSTWYTNPFANLVIKANSEFGFLNSYNKDVGLPPFERFYVGGDGLTGFAMDGREVIGLRGYANQTVSQHLTAGGSIYSKYYLEMRYPLSLDPSATVYATAFAEAGNAWDSFDKFNPFEVKRSLGFGIRIFMPMFGLLGVDFGHGYDPLEGATEKSGWQTHFSIGQQF
ncbi:outer membrane protein assembly factor BamA [Flavobacteriales bacterium]|nr:outer membrane protein assembly factor BamA [Flavobacteriales bacterium]MDG1146400.1 outer membrane protein assembly factor BamA [Flavobacteriales bacterium]MDG1395962.1 outer membrane protein assembly factor BamA [Flavobacteriales bacterium]